MTNVNWDGFEVVKAKSRQLRADWIGVPPVLLPMVKGGLEEAFGEILNGCIAEELILEEFPDATQDDIKEATKAAGNNPWNAGHLYALLKLMKERQVQ